ncbi:MAG TPA: AMP-binding protein [Rhodospirillaceae bacterium]|nr:AMP-binding protein [Rhodospirillaceae bacterium]
MAIIDFFDRGWASNPQGAAYIAGQRSYGFAEIGAMSCRIAHALLAQGFAKETKGAVLAGNDPIAWTCTLGLWRAGLAWVPVNPRASAEENRHVLDAFDCEVVFFQKLFEPMVAALRPSLPKVARFVCIDAELDWAPELQGWCAGQPDTPPDITYDMDEVVAVMSTGGTTGLPKGVMNTHRSIQTFCAHFMIGCAYPGGQRPVNLAAAPMTHTAGILSLPATARGGTVVVLQKPDPADLLAAISRHKVTEMFLPPTVIYRLLEIPGIDKVDFSSLRYFVYGAAPMSVEKLKQAIALFGPVMTGGYGQTEAPASISMLTPDQHFEDGRLAGDSRLASCGRPSPLIRVSIQDDAGRQLPPGQTGEICVRGDLVMKGYYKQPDKTAEAIIDGWLHTGDVGSLDAEGYLCITDRKKDMIITGGFNVYPNEVEQVLCAHPAVQDCAVIGVPDAKWGEAVKAVVEVKAGTTVTAEDLIALCKDRLGGVKTPKSIDFLDSLPRSPVGKVLKKDLRQAYWSGQQRSI